MTEFWPPCNEGVDRIIPGHGQAGQFELPRPDFTIINLLMGHPGTEYRTSASRGGASRIPGSTATAMVPPTIPLRGKSMGSDSIDAKIFEIAISIESDPFDLKSP